MCCHALAMTVVQHGLVVPPPPHYYNGIWGSGDFLPHHACFPHPSLLLGLDRLDGRILKKKNTKERKDAHTMHPKQPLQ